MKKTCCNAVVKTPTSCEGDPPGISRSLVVPVRHHQQSTADSEGDDAQDDEEECGDPLWGQLWGDACPVSAMDGLALSDQTHGQRTCKGENSSTGAELVLDMEADVDAAYCD